MVHILICREVQGGHRTGKTTSQKYHLMKKMVMNHADEEDARRSPPVVTSLKRSLDVTSSLHQHTVELQNQESEESHNALQPSQEEIECLTDLAFIPVKAQECLPTLKLAI